MRSRKSSRVAAFVLAVATAWLHPASADVQGIRLPAASVDHHLHIQGPQLTAVLKQMAERSPELFKGIDPGLLDARTGNDALRVLDEAGIEQGVLLSVAYAFASPFAKQDPRDIARLTRLENEYNVAAALHSGGRLLAFIGVNPLWDGAEEELRYWAHRDGVTGVKLQLGNSGFDPSSSSEVAKLAKLFGAALTADLAIVIHARGAPAHARVAVQRFIDEVLPHAGDLPVQIAHAGGGGGLDEATLDGLSAYADAIARRAPGTKHLVFDLSVVVVDDQTDGQLARRLADLIGKVGPERFVMASDWPSVHTPKVYNALLESQLPLTTAQWRVILSNRAPYFGAWRRQR